MNHAKRTFRTFIFLTLFLLTGSISVSAADAKPPAAVKDLKAAQYSETSVKLSWKKASQATGYYIYQISASGALKQVGKTGNTNFIVKKLKPETPYSFCVYSYRKSGKKTLKSELPSNTVTRQTTIYTPTTPKNLHTTSVGSHTVSLSWNYSKNASGYTVYKYDTEKKTYVEAGRTQKNKISIGGLPNDTQIKFIVKACRTVQNITKWSNASSDVSAVPKAMPSNIRNIRSVYYRVTLKKSASAQNLTKKKTVTLHKGTKLIVNAKTGAYVSGNVVSSGDKIKVKRSYLNYYGLDTTHSKDYSQSAKETFVNYKGYHSPSKWLIWISQYKCRVNVFYGSQGKWKLKKVFSCNIGTWQCRTPTGIKRIISKSAYGKYGSYYLKFTPNGNAFHQLMGGVGPGVPASHGCIRMSISALRYLYENCPVGTTVVSY